MLAAIVLAQAIALDPASGVWFPPGSWRDEYIARKRSHGQDVREAFDRDPKLKAAVCAAVAKAPAPGPSVEPALRQMRAGLDVLCVAANAREREQSERGLRDAAVDAFLTKRLNAALDAAAAIPVADRKTAQRALLQTIDDLPAGEAHLAAIFKLIVLRPQDARGAWYLLQATRDTEIANSRLNELELAQWIERVYRTRNGAEWKSGLPEVLFYLGKDEEARQLARFEIDASDYQRMAIAVYEEITGREGSIAATLRRCGDRDLCRATVWSLATRGAKVRPHRTLPPLAALVDMTVPWYANNWPVRLEAIRVLSDLDRARARRQITLMYTERDAPHPAILDLVSIDSALAADEHDDLRAIALQDCWLLLRNAKLRPFRGDAWTRLAALPVTGKPVPACDVPSEDPGEDTTFSGCTAFGLRRRLHIAIEARQWAFARQSLDKLVAWTLDGKLTPEVPRFELANLAVALASLGCADEAARIVRYLDRQPLMPETAAMIDQIRARLPKSNEVVLEPWRESGAGALPQVCGN